MRTRSHFPARSEWREAARHSFDRSLVRDAETLLVSARRPGCNRWKRRILVPRRAGHPAVDRKDAVATVHDRERAPGWYPTITRAASATRILY